MHRVLGLAVVLAVAAAGCHAEPSRATMGRALPRSVGPAPPVDAHDGTVIQDGATFWLFGTAYGCGFALNRVGTRWCGVSAYSSTDLWEWTPRGHAVAPTDPWVARCSPPRFGCFRPHVARSPRTGLWVMWINTYDTPTGYRVLTAPSPAGPWAETATPPELAVGGRVLPSRGDHDIFVDSQGRGWLAYTIIENGLPIDIAVERLEPDLTSGTGHAVRVGAGIVEAPALFEREGRFFLTYSDPACPYCPAATGMASADDPLGPWLMGPRLSARSCAGQPAEVSLLRMAEGSVWLYVSDRWQPRQPNQAGATLWWEPLTFHESGLPNPPRCYLEGQPSGRDTRPAVVPSHS